MAQNGLSFSGSSKCLLPKDLSAGWLSLTSVRQSRRLLYPDRAAGRPFGWLCRPAAYVFT